MFEQGTLSGLPGFNLNPIALSQAHSGKPSVLGFRFSGIPSSVEVVLKNWMRIVLIFKLIFTLNLAGYH